MLDHNHLVETPEQGTYASGRESCAQAIFRNQLHAALMSEEWVITTRDSEHTGGYTVLHNGEEARKFYHLDTAQTYVVERYRLAAQEA